MFTTKFRATVFLQGDAHKNDPMYRIENAIAFEDHNVNGQNFQTGVFDIVLERAAK
jgi:chemotaxis methyl-accepting protein methylase